MQAAIGEELRARRQRRKWSLEDMHKRSGVALSSIRRYEKGDRSMPLDKFAALAQTLDTTLLEITEAAAANHPEAFRFTSVAEGRSV